MPRVCSRFIASRVAGSNLARQGAERRAWLFPSQALQHSLAKFDTRPLGTKVHVAQGGVARSLLGTTKLRFSRLALHHVGFRRGCNETGTDPKGFSKRRGIVKGLRAPHEAAQ